VVGPPDLRRLPRALRRHPHLARRLGRAEAELRANLGPLADIPPQPASPTAWSASPSCAAARACSTSPAGLLEAADAALPRAARAPPSLALDRGDPATGAVHEAERALRRLPAGGLNRSRPALEILVRARLRAGERQPRARPPSSCATIAAAARHPPRAPRRRRSPRAARPPGDGPGRRRGRPSRTPSTSTRASAGAGRRAQARRQLARALRALGHDEAAEREARAADEGAAHARRAAPAAPDARAGRPDRARGRGPAASSRRGRSNQEIATELVLSVRTVERHIANIYDKIGASGPGPAPPPRPTRWPPASRDQRDGYRGARDGCPHG
jgi:hypothetical protein